MDSSCVILEVRLDGLKNLGRGLSLRFVGNLFHRGYSISLLVITRLSG
jgi:hypothetical protein